MVCSFFFIIISTSHSGIGVILASKNKLGSSPSHNFVKKCAELLSFFPLNNSGTYQWSHMELEFIRENFFYLQIQFFLMEIDFLVYLFLLRSPSILSNCQIYGHKLLHNIPILFFDVCRIFNGVPALISDISNLYFFSFLLL